MSTIAVGVLASYPAASDWLVDSCSALPVNEQLDLLNEQIEVLRQRLKRSMCPATADPSAESVSTAANAAPAAPAQVTTAANANRSFVLESWLMLSEIGGKKHKMRLAATAARCPLCTVAEF